jgi:hypothetical protein
LAAYFASPDRVRQTFFFPRLTGRPPAQKVRYAGEERLVPARHGLEARVAAVVDELLLGPEDPDNLPLAGKGTRLLGVVAAGGTVYVNLTSGLLSEGAAVPPEVQVQAIADTIYFNFPAVRKAYVFVDGQAPDFSGTTGDPAYDFRSGVPRTYLVERQ